MENKILDFYGPGCGNCKMLEPILKQLQGEHTNVVFEKLDIRENDELVDKYGVTSLPTLVFLKNGEMVEKMVGLKPKPIIGKKIVEIFGS